MNSFIASGMEGLASPDSVDEVDTACSYFYFLWGRNAELNGHDDEAEEAYEKAIVCDGQDSYIVRRLAALLLKMGKKVQAINWMEKLIARHPEDVRIKIFLADLYASSDDTGKAVKIYKHILLTAPKNNTVMLKLGKLYLRDLDYTKARSVFENLVKESPDSIAGLYYLARLYRELGYSDKAATIYERSLAVNWSVPLAMETAGFYERQKKDKQAAIIYRKILADNDEDEAAIGRLVRIYLRNHDAPKALALLTDLRGKTTDSLKIDFTIGRIYLEQKEYGRAVKLYKKMLTENPKSGAIRSLLALSYYESGAREQARDLLLAVSPDNEDYDDAILLLVKIYADEDDYNGAADLLRGAIAKAQGDEQLNFYFALAALYEEGKTTSEADMLFRKLVGKFSSAKVYLKYGMFLDRLGRQDEALAEMEKVLAMEPDNIMALNYVGYTWADRGIKLEKALQYIKKAISGRPDDGFIRDSLAWVYFRLGDLQQSVVEFKKALLDEPDDPTIHEHLGDVYNAMQDYNNALKNYRNSEKLSEKDEKGEQRDRLRGKIKAILDKINIDSVGSDGA